MTAGNDQPVQYLCNRSACRAEGATYWNTSTRAYYCKKCADAINEGAGTKITGVPLCVPLTSMPLPVVQAAPYHKEFPKRESSNRNATEQFYPIGCKVSYEGEIGVVTLHETEREKLNRPNAKCRCDNVFVKFNNPNFVYVQGWFFTCDLSHVRNDIEGQS